MRIIGRGVVPLVAISQLLSITSAQSSTDLPSCAKSGFKDAVAAAGCTSPTCYCTIPDFKTTFAKEFSRSCSTDDIQQADNYIFTICSDALGFDISIPGFNPSSFSASLSSASASSASTSSRSSSSHTTTSRSSSSASTTPPSSSSTNASPSTTPSSTPSSTNTAALSSGSNTEPSVVRNSKLKPGAIGGIFVGCLAFIVGILTLVFLYRKRKHKDQDEKDAEAGAAVAMTDRNGHGGNGPGGAAADAPTPFPVYEDPVAMGAVSAKEREKHEARETMVPFLGAGGRVDRSPERVGGGGAAGGYEYQDSDRTQGYNDHSQGPSATYPPVGGHRGGYSSRGGPGAGRYGPPPSAQQGGRHDGYSGRGGRGGGYGGGRGRGGYAPAAGGGGARGGYDGAYDNQGRGTYEDHPYEYAQPSQQSQPPPPPHQQQVYSPIHGPPPLSTSSARPGPPPQTSSHHSSGSVSRKAVPPPSSSTVVSPIEPASAGGGRDPEPGIESHPSWSPNDDVVGYPSSGIPPARGQGRGRGVPDYYD